MLPFATTYSYQTFFQADRRDGEESSEHDKQMGLKPRQLLSVNSELPYHDDNILIVCLLVFGGHVPFWRSITLHSRSASQVNHRRGVQSRLPKLARFS